MRIIARTATVAIASVIMAAPVEGQLEVELDPIAFAMGGYSLHLAHGLGSTRLDIGVFGLDVPESIHGNRGWTQAFDGVGLKWDYVGTDPFGLFVGLDGGYMRNRYSRRGEAGSELRDVTGLGVRAGYRFRLTDSFYVVPWVSVSRLFGAHDVHMGQGAFSTRTLQVFPTVHVGWRLP